MKLIIEPQNRDKVLDWIATRGGVAVWQNCDLGSSKLGQELLTPATRADGTPATPPHWSCGHAPDRIVTDAVDVGVREWREVSRIKIRPGPPYTGGVNRTDRFRLDKALAQAGEGASWKWNWESGQYGSAWREAIIEVPGPIQPLVAQESGVSR